MDDEKEPFIILSESIVSGPPVTREPNNSIDMFNGYLLYCFLMRPIAVTHRRKSSSTESSNHANEHGISR